MLHTKYISCIGFMASEKNFYLLFFFFFKFSHLMGANEPRGVANLDPRGMVGRIYVEYHQTSLYTQSVSSGSLFLILYRFLKAL